MRATALRQRKDGAKNIRIAETARSCTSSATEIVPVCPFFGNEDAGHDFAVLYTLVASCEKHGVDAIEYITDVLTRVHTHPQRRIDELLPHRWKPPDKAPP